jgi:lycopene cyclase domain-containing protein
LTSKYLYLLIDLLVLAVPLAVSFHPKSTFYKHWKNAGIGLIITTAFFLLWDVLFVQFGIRSVNEHYVIGIYIGPLPVEEVLFFVGIPFAGLVTYFALNQLFEKDRLFPHQEIISSALIVVLLISGLYHKDKLYTAAAFLMLAVFLAFQMLKLRPRYMGRFYFSFAFLLVPLLFVSGILTGAFIDDEVVRYDDAQNLGIRIGTIPVEDVFGAMLLLVMPITVWEWLEDYLYYKSRR